MKEKEAKGADTRKTPLNNDDKYNFVSSIRRRAREVERTSLNMTAEECVNAKLLCASVLFNISNSSRCDINHSRFASCLSQRLRVNILDQLIFFSLLLLPLRSP